MLIEVVRRITADNQNTEKLIKQSTTGETNDTMRMQKKSKPPVELLLPQAHSVSFWTKYSLLRLCRLKHAIHHYSLRFPKQQYPVRGDRAVVSQSSTRWAGSQCIALPDCSS